MTDLAGAVQIALFTALSAVDGMPPVVSEVPINDQDQVVYPFVLLGNDPVTNIGGKFSRYEQHEPSIHVCMQSVPKLAVRAVQELVRAALVDQPIAAPGALLDKPIAMNADTPIAEDGATYIGTQTFKIFAQPAG